MATMWPPSFAALVFLRTAHVSMCSVGTDAHTVERAVYEGERHDEKDRGEYVREAAALRGGQLHGKLHGEKSEERRELDDRVECDGGSVLEWIADGVADDRGVMERGAFLLQLDFHNFLGVVPGAAGVGHKNCLIQAEDGDGN